MFKLNLWSEYLLNFDFKSCAISSINRDNNSIKIKAHLLLLSDKDKVVDFDITVHDEYDVIKGIFGIDNGKLMVLSDKSYIETDSKINMESESIYITFIVRSFGKIEDEQRCTLDYDNTSGHNEQEDFYIDRSSLEEIIEKLICQDVPNDIVAYDMLKNLGQ